jgi:hypothetical protein
MCTAPGDRNVGRRAQSRSMRRSRSSRKIVCTSLAGPSCDTITTIYTLPDPLGSCQRRRKQADVRDVDVNRSQADTPAGAGLTSTCSGRPPRLRHTCASGGTSVALHRRRHQAELVGPLTRSRIHSGAATGSKMIKTQSRTRFVCRSYRTRSGKPPALPLAPPTTGRRHSFGNGSPCASDNPEALCLLCATRGWSQGEH